MPASCHSQLSTAGQSERYRRGYASESGATRADDAGVLESTRDMPRYAARDLAAGTIGTATVGVGFPVSGAAAALALWWGTRAYQRAMA